MANRPLEQLGHRDAEHGTVHGDRTGRASPRDLRRITHLALRWVLGLTLLATSLGKALDVTGFRDVLRDYDLFPVWSLSLIALAMPVIEAAIAFTMLTGRWLRAGILGSGLLHGSFAVILTAELWRGVDLQNCGCFGVFLARPLTWFSPLEDLALLAITIGIAATIARPMRRSAVGVAS